MIDAPFLTLPEVRQEVERIFSRHHRSQLVALFGRGEASDFEIGGKRWRVVPTQCELELREMLPRPDKGHAEGSVFLIDWTPDMLPLDIACRLAGGRLYHVARDARLAALFGARQVESGLAGTALAKLFLSGSAPHPRKVQGLLLTRSVAWTSLLEGRLRCPETALLSPGALLAWAVSNEGGPAFFRLAEADELWKNVRRELREWLGSKLGDAAVVVWDTWEQGLAPRLLEVLPLLRAARDSGDSFLAGHLVGQLSAWLPDLAGAVWRVEGVLTDDDSLNAALPSERGPLLQTLQRSQSLAEEAGLESLTLCGGRLPASHRACESVLAGATRAFLDHPGSEEAASVVEALARLAAHELDRHLRSEDHRAARRNLGRLALWLAGRGPSRPPETRWRSAVELARRYAEEGGYVDWARQQLRALRGADEALLSAARSLDVAAVNALREEHRSFAAAYVSWVDAGKPSKAAIPIEDVGKQVIAPFLKGDNRRKLLVILMDGMSYTAAVQIMSRLESARRWGPIAWRKEGWDGSLSLPPVLAAAPTLTEISRAAFFAGRADAHFGEEDTRQDAARWKANRSISEIVGDEAPSLFVRSDILSGHDLALDIRDSIKGDCRVVAVIVNAIDEDLKGSLQVAKDYSLAPVLALEAMLSAAEEGERVVLLVSDHGHVLGDGTRPVEGRLSRGRPGGARWRALADGEAPQADEVALPSTSWVPHGWHRVAALWDPSVVYRAANYGEHGGLSLPESVAPAILIAPDWLERAVPDDPELAIRPTPTPDWWELRVRRSVENAAPAPSAQHEQPSLFAPSKAVHTRPATQKIPPLVQALGRSTQFQSQTTGLPVAEVQRVLSWVTILAEAGGSLPAREFAAAAGVRTNQVGNVVARMGVLNADGFAMVEHDPVQGRVILHSSRLLQHYGLKEDTAPRA